jgi:hypothetical protein
MRRHREITETTMNPIIPPEYTHDQLFNIHLIWPADQKKEELKTMKTALQEKTMKFFKATTGFTLHNINKNKEGKKY